MRVLQILDIKKTWEEGSTLFRLCNLIFVLYHPHEMIVEGRWQVMGEEPMVHMFDVGNEDYERFQDPRNTASLAMSKHREHIGRFDASSLFLQTQELIVHQNKFSWELTPDDLETVREWLLLWAPDLINRLATDLSTGLSAFDGPA